MAGSSTREVGRLRQLAWAIAFILLSPVAIVLFVLTTVSAALVVAWVGIPPTLGFVALTRRFADRYRRWSARTLGVEIPRPYQPVPDGGLLAKLVAIRRDPATWRDHAWLAVNGSAGLALSCLHVALFFAGVGHLTLFTWWGFLPGDAEFPPVAPVDFLTVTDVASAAYICIPVGLVYLVLWWLFGQRLSRTYARLNRWLLAPGEQSRLAIRVRELAASRSDTVDTQAAELRRIERDLHDGAQARLVALGS